MGDFANSAAVWLEGRSVIAQCAVRPMDVFLESCRAYSPDQIDAALEQWDSIFSERIHPGDLVVLKPNWIAGSHKYDPQEWQSVVTHPEVITSVPDAWSSPMVRKRSHRGRRSCRACVRTPGSIWAADVASKSIFWTYAM